MQLIIDYIQKVLENQKDPYHQTPLLADAINIHTDELFRWKNKDYTSSVVSNLATQQNFMRLLVGASALTGDTSYKEAAVATTDYVLQHYMSPDGLLCWGGHTYIDLESLKEIGPDNKSMAHELKNCFPYYDLMFEVDKEKTMKFIQAFWNAHVYDWEELEVGRHGEHSKVEKPYPFNHPFVQKEPHRCSTGLSFINAGSDLIYAAAKYYEYTKDENAYKWSEFLAYQYVAARDPYTKLGAYQFTQKVQTIDPVAVGAADADTLSWYGDRAKRQFGHRYPSALESKMLLKGGPNNIYGMNMLMQLQIFNEIGSKAKQYKTWSIEGLLAFVTKMYDEKSYKIKPMMTDGTDLSGYVLEKDGYYGAKGTKLEPALITPQFLLALTRAYLSVYKDQDTCDLDKQKLWNAIRSMSEGLGLGDIGEVPGATMKLNKETEVDDGRLLLALLDLYEVTHREEVLDIAQIVRKNILSRCHHKGYFVHHGACTYSEIDMIEPLALLALEATLQGKQSLIPRSIGGKGYIDGDFLLPNGEVRCINTALLYGLL